MPAMAKIAATICREKEREEEEHQRKIDGRHATRCAVMKTTKPFTAAQGHSRHTCPRSGYSLQESQASEDKGCKGAINMWVLFYCQQGGKLQAHTHK